MLHPNSSLSAAKLLPAVAAAAIAAVSLVGGARADYTVSPPSSVPTSYTDSSPVTPPSNLVSGLSAQLWTITPTTNLGNYDPAGLDGGAGTGGYPNLQGLANEETLAQNGTITIPPPPIGQTAGSGTYDATPLFSFIDAGINTYGYIYTKGGNNVESFLGGNDPGATNLLTGVTVPTSVQNTAWTDILFDQRGYVYVSQANSSYTFGLQSNDDGTEVLLGGNGAIGSGTVVGFQNAKGASATTDTVTFTQAGYYPFEIFNSQTWGSANLQANFIPVGNAPALTFYTATPEPTAALLLAAGTAGLVLLRRRGSRA